jgi:hypothetical protein
MAAKLALLGIMSPNYGTNRGKECRGGRTLREPPNFVGNHLVIYFAALTI